MSCGRQWCPKCGEERIHRDNRKRYESASCLGQIVWREGPVALSVTDLDLVSRKGLRNGLELLYLIEQKQPGHEVSQYRTLCLLSDIIAYFVLHQPAPPRIDPRSGVYIIRGQLGAATEAQRKTIFIGPQKVFKLINGDEVELGEFKEHEDFFRWLDPENSRRRNNDEDR